MSVCLSRSSSAIGSGSTSLPLVTFYFDWTEIRAALKTRCLRSGAVHPAQISPSFLARRTTPTPKFRCNCCRVRMWRSPRAPSARTAAERNNRQKFTKKIGNPTALQVGGRGATADRGCKEGPARRGEAVRWRVYLRSEDRWPNGGAWSRGQGRSGVQELGRGVQRAHGRYQCRSWFDTYAGSGCTPVSQSGSGIESVVPHGRPARRCDPGGCDDESISASTVATGARSCACPLLVTVLPFPFRTPMSVLGQLPLAPLPAPHRLERAPGHSGHPRHCRLWPD
jgi:hypothetical protein